MSAPIKTRRVNLTTYVQHQAQMEEQVGRTVSVAHLTALLSSLTPVSWTPKTRLHCWLGWIPKVVPVQSSTTILEVSESICGLRASEDFSFALCDARVFIPNRLSVAALDADRGVLLELRMIKRQVLQRCMSMTRLLPLKPLAEYAWQQIIPPGWVQELEIVATSGAGSRACRSMTWHSPCGL